MPQWQHRTPAGASARLQAADARAYAFRTSSSLLPWPLPDIRLSDSAALDLRGTSSSLRPQPIKRLMNIIGVLPNFRTLALWAIPCCIRSQSQAISTKQHLCRHMLSTPTPCICSITRLNRLSSLDRQAHGHQRFPFGQHAVHIQRMSNVRIHAPPRSSAHISACAQHHRHRRSPDIHRCPHPVCGAGPSRRTIRGTSASAAYDDPRLIT